MVKRKISTDSTLFTGIAGPIERSSIYFYVHIKYLKNERVRGCQFSGDRESGVRLWFEARTRVGFESRHRRKTPQLQNEAKNNFIVLYSLLTE